MNCKTSLWRKNVFFQIVIVSILLILPLQDSFARVEWWISGHVVIPRLNEDGSFDYEVVPILDFNVFLAEPWWKIRFEFGWNEFEVDDIVDPIRWTNVSGSLFHQFDLGAVDPYVKIGPGLYLPKEGSARPGVKIGLGVDYAINDRFSFELGTDYHNIFLQEQTAYSSDKNFSFQTFQLGILYKLK